MEVAGITVVPFIDTDGAPCVEVVIVGTDADQTVVIDAQGAELALGHRDGKFQILDFRGADAVSG